MKYRYRASRGGHAPGFLRDALVHCIEDESLPWYAPLADEEFVLRQDAKWKRMDLKQRGLWLLGQLWNCTDVLPGSCCADLEIPAGSSYAVAVRKLKADMDIETA